MPSRRKTGYWQSTVAGTLSVHSPSLFCSGTQQLGESGWWTLQKVSPPRIDSFLKQAAFNSQLGTTSNSASAVGEQCQQSITEDGVVPDEHHSSAAISRHISATLTCQEKSPLPSNSRPNDTVQPLSHFSERQERMLANHLRQIRSQLGSSQQSTKAKRLHRKLTVRQLQRDHDLRLFSSDSIVSQSVKSKALLGAEEPAGQAIIPHLSPEDISQPMGQVHYSQHVHSQARRILDRTSAVTLIPKHGHYCFLESIMGCKQPSGQTCITSPLTSRVLHPCIYRSREFSPLKVQLLQELVCKVNSSERYQMKFVEFSYFQEKHLTAVNSLVSYFFWPVDLREYLQYPDFTVVVAYGKLVVGCGFMTPDVKVTESYISFLLIHPDFRRAGIGKVMLYHLVQSCFGKDVTLHVSVDNPAMLLYQQFGFKAEQLCLDFYDKYYPPGYHYSKHAFLMRLRR